MKSRQKKGFGKDDRSGPHLRPDVTRATKKRSTATAATGKNKVWTLEFQFWRRCNGIVCVCDCVGSCCFPPALERYTVRESRCSLQLSVEVSSYERAVRITSSTQPSHASSTPSRTRRSQQRAAWRSLDAALHTTSQEATGKHALGLELSHNFERCKPTFEALLSYYFLPDVEPSLGVRCRCRRW